MRTRKGGLYPLPPQERYLGAYRYACLPHSDILLLNLGSAVGSTVVLAARRRCKSIPSYTSQEYLDRPSRMDLSRLSTSLVSFLVLESGGQR